MAIDLAFVYKYLPAYRLGVYNEIIKDDNDFDITFYSGQKEQEAIKLVDWTVLSEYCKLKLAKTYFYRPSLLLWQSGIIRNILFSKHQVFVFDGAISHIPVWIFLILCKLKGKKALLWSHGFKGIDKGLKLRIRLLFFKKLASGNILYGHTQKDVMLSLGFDYKTLTVVYNSLQPKVQRKVINGLKSEYIKQEKAKYFREPNLFTILFIGRLVKGKQVLLIAQLCADLHKQGRKVNCIYIGKGEEEDALKDEIINNSLSNYVHFTGAIYEEENLAQYFAMSDLMVSPGNVGLNCIHSLGYGLPVMTHDNFEYQNPEVEAIEDGKTGIFFKYGNYDNMLNKTKNFIETEYNKEDFKKACFDKIDSFYNPVNQAHQIKIAVQNIMENGQ